MMHCGRQHFGGGGFKRRTREVHFEGALKPKKSVHDAGVYMTAILKRIWGKYDKNWIHVAQDKDKWRVKVNASAGCTKAENMLKISL
jgi:hypothetical protein